jgi:hypothetical protein
LIDFLNNALLNFSERDSVMPTIYGMELPQPKDWQEFERITLDAIKLKWSSPNLQRNGRPGQNQNGVDIWGVDYLGRPVGIQCKNTVLTIKIKTINEEIKKSAGFEGMLTALYIATTAEPDQKLQKAVRVLSEARSMRGEFAVGILYWEDIFSGLVLDRTILTNHYPQLKISDHTTGHASTQQYLSALAVGYYGRFLWEFIDLIFGEFGLLANEDPEQVRTILRIIRKNIKIAEQEIVDEIFQITNDVESEIYKADKQNIDWEKVKILAKRVQDRVKYLPPILENQITSNFIELGMTLGFVYHGNGNFQEKLSDKIYRQARALLPDSDARLVEALRMMHGVERYSAGPYLYSFIEQEIRSPLPK